jgi:uncharacterized membrane protein
MTEDDRLTPRHLIAVTALLSGLVALYLHLWKLGLAGTLACGGEHGCELVQFSPWSYFFGIDVALIGTIGYALIFGVAMVGTLARWKNSRGITFALMALIFPAILFTIRLKYYEFFVLDSFCPWCAVSAVTITLHGVLVVLDWRRVSR